MILSIIVPTYNVEKYIGNCLDSLLNQDLDKKVYEIIVINDGSTDDSGSIVNNYAKLHENIFTYHQKNMGLSASRNKGISLARGEYIYFIDSDDYIASNTLGYIISLLKQYNLDILCSQVKVTRSLTIHEADNLHSIISEHIEVLDGITYIATHNYLNNAWYYFINKKFLEKTGLVFPEGRFVEDANFTAKLFSCATKISSTSIDFYRYYIRPNSIMRNKSKDHLKKMVNDYEKNIMDFNTQIEKIKTIDHPKKVDCLKRLITRQQSFVFFMLVRCLKLRLPFKEIASIIDRLEKSGNYPINKFIGEDYNKVSYKILVPILNNKNLLYLFLIANSLFKFPSSLFKE